MLVTIPSEHSVIHQHISLNPHRGEDEGGIDRGEDGGGDDRGEKIEEEMIQEKMEKMEEEKMEEKMEKEKMEKEKMEEEKMEEEKMVGENMEEEKIMDERIERLNKCDCCLKSFALYRNPRQRHCSVFVYTLEQILSHLTDKLTICNGDFPHQAN